eukprot:2359148-Rhodomonas_salina.5
MMVLVGHVLLMCGRAIASATMRGTIVRNVQYRRSAMCGTARLKKAYVSDIMPYYATMCGTDVGPYKVLKWRMLPVM